MTTPDLEDRLPEVLRHLATDVHAPATLEAGRSVRHRSAALRHRRRRVRAGVGSGLLAVVLVAGGVWVATGTGEDPRSDVSTDPADGDGDGPTGPIPGVPVGVPGDVPGLTIDHPEAKVVAAYDGALPDVDIEQGRATGSDGVTRQVFRRPGDYAGPLVRVSTGPVEAIRVEGLEISDDPTDGPVDLSVGILETRFLPLGDGTAVRTDALGLTAEELDAFTTGLRPSGDGSGQDATVVPAGLEELVVDTSGEPTVPMVERVVDLDFGPERHQIYLRLESIERSDPTLLEAVFLGGVWDRRTSAPRDGRRVEVLGRPALLIDSGAEPELLWLHTSTTVVDLHLPAGRAGTVDELIAGIREMSPDKWAQLDATVPDRR